MSISTRVLKDAMEIWQKVISISFKIMFKQHHIDTSLTDQMCLSFLSDLMFCFYLQTHTCIVYNVLRFKGQTSFILSVVW